MNLQNKSFISNLTVGINKRLGRLVSNKYKKVNMNWLDLKYYKHLANGKERTHKMLGNLFHFTSPAEFMHGIQEIFIDDIYAIDLGKAPLILDCGANIGMSVLYLKNNHPDATIWAFEPDATNFELLEKNIRSFALSNVILYKEAVWIEDGEISFSGESSMSSKIDEGMPNEKRNTVACCRLKKHMNQKIDLLKIDIEGAEYKVLNDIKENLHWVSNMFLEYHGSFEQNNELCEILQWIQDAGMKFYIKEAAPVYPTPFKRALHRPPYDVQLNIFCFR